MPSVTEPGAQTVLSKARDILSVCVGWGGDTKIKTGGDSVLFHGFTCNIYELLSFSLLEFIQ